MIEGSNNFIFKNFPELKNYNYQSYDNKNILSEEEGNKEIE